MKGKDGWYNRFFDGVYSRVLGAQFDHECNDREAAMIKRLLKARKGQKVLDVPCGKGRITIPLAKLGLEMTGADLTESFLRSAKRCAKKEGADIRFLRSDMRNIDFEGAFHAAFNWFGSFGYFSDEDNLLFCRKVFKALKPGGRFLVEGPNKSFIETHFRANVEHRIGGVLIKVRNRWDTKGERIRGSWTFITKDGRREQKKTDMRIFNAAEMRALLRSAGFREITFHGRPSLARFTRHSKRLIAVARKPKR